MLEEMIGKKVTVVVKSFGQYSGHICKGRFEDMDDKFVKIKYEKKKWKITKCINKAYISEIFTIEE